MSKQYRGVPEQHSARYGANQGVRRPSYNGEVISPVGVVIALLVAFAAAGGVVYALWSNGFFGGEEAPLQEGSQARQDAGEGGGDAAATQTASASKVDLVAFGDMVVSWSVFNSGMPEEGERNYNHLFRNVQNEIDAADVAIISQETPLGGEQFGWSEEPNFNGPQEIGDSLAVSGFDVILKASNHALDQGAAGLAAELDFWSGAHPTMQVIGAVRQGSTDNPNPPYIYEKDGLKIAIFNYTLASDVPADDEGGSYQGMLATLEEERLRNDIVAVRDHVDIVVVCPHWGSENYSAPDMEQQQWAEFLLGLGVDVVFGTRPHVLQPVEVMTGEDGHKMVCFWSLGCFINGLYTNANMVGGMAKVTIEKGETGYARITGYGLYPTVTHVAAGEEETTYMLYAYTDQLAETSRFSAVTPAWAKDTCAQVLGEHFDRETSRMWVDLQ